jgi:hypothetical protein
MTPIEPIQVLIIEAIFVLQPLLFPGLIGEIGVNRCFVLGSFGA